MSRPRTAGAQNPHGHRKSTNIFPDSPFRAVRASLRNHGASDLGLFFLGNGMWGGMAIPPPQPEWRDCHPALHECRYDLCVIPDYAPPPPRWKWPSQKAIAVICSGVFLIWLGASFHLHTFSSGPSPKVATTRYTKIRPPWSGFDADKEAATLAGPFVTYDDCIFFGLVLNRECTMGPPTTVIISCPITLFTTQPTSDDADAP